MSIRTIRVERAKAPEKLEILLTENEDKLCTLLDECRTSLADEGTNTSCRIAGGWVRDKLLGLDSNDIDIALEDMMGVSFAEKLVAMLAKDDGAKADEEQEAKTNVDEGNEAAAEVKMSVVKSNPDQSKHLETAKVYPVLGFEIDLVNLRSEEYAEDSRIPIVAFGTPLQDALRRDITINALFYNVHSRSVEDQTEKGLQDLRDGIIRTPLPPRETFLDDPLRVIRCVRFASRFGFDMVPELKEAARDSEIQEAFRKKISKPRIAEEMHKMMKGCSPLHSIQLIDELNLWPVIFDVPTSIQSTFNPQPSPFHTALTAASLLHLFVAPTPSEATSSVPLPSVHPTIVSQLATDPTSAARLFLACTLTPYRSVSYTDSKKKTHPASEAALRDGLTMGTQFHYLDGIPALFEAWELIMNSDVWRYVEGTTAEESANEARKRVEIGLFLREKHVHNPNTGSHWTTSLLFSLVQELVTLWDPAADHLDYGKAGKLVEKYNRLVTLIEDLDLPAAVDAKPILTGRDVVRVLEEPKPGPWTGAVLSRVVEWQLEHPQGTQELCEQWLRAEKAEGRIDILKLSDAAHHPGPKSAGAIAGAKRGKSDGGNAKRAKKE